MLSSTSAVSVSAGAKAEVGTYTINSVTQLAEEAKMTSSAVFTGDSMSTGTTLAALELSTALVFEAGSITFSINDVEFSFSESDSIGNMMTEINNSSAGR